METHHERSVQLVFKRTEAKCLLARDQKERLCALMAGRMVPDEHGASTIRNLYLDTPSLIFARRSAEHPFYKEKLRIRSYAPAFPEDQVFSGAQEEGPVPKVVGDAFQPGSCPNSNRMEKEAAIP
jgi:hypothetical protein